MTCELGITFADESKDFCVEKSFQSTCRRGKQTWLAKVAGENGATRRKSLIMVFATHKYVNNQQPRVSHTTDLKLGWTVSWSTTTENEICQIWG